MGMLLLILLLQERHVAPTGSDAAAGTAAAPWRTIQKAAKAAAPGETVFIHAGTYAESVRVGVSGVEGKPITFKAAGDGLVRIDGSTLKVPEGTAGLIVIEQKSHLVFEGLELGDLQSADEDCVPCGVRLEGSGRNIILRRLKVGRIRHTSKEGGDAHGIAVYGTDGTTPWSGILIEDCEVFECRLGSSEALVINGNVEGFVISGNTVRDCNNIGIDVIGLEKTAPMNDQPRRGRVVGNKVFNISSFGNPAYGDERSAGGIYVDGARDIIVERNLVHHCDYGIEVGCENPGTTADVVVRSNLLLRNAVAGLIFGGYDEERGTVERCLFAHNTLWGNDTSGSGSGEIVIQKARNNTLRHNLIVPGAAGLAITNPFGAALSSGNVADWNCYGVKAPRFVWQEKELLGLAPFRAAGQERNGRVGEARFKDAERGDLHLRKDSMAVNAGDPAFTAVAGELDFDGLPRIAGARVDAGAFEFRN